MWGALVVAASLAGALADESRKEELAAVEELSKLMLEDLVTEVQKRTESLQDVPLAVSALDAQGVHQRDLIDVEDLSGRVPNLYVTALWGSSSPKIFLRGVGNNSFNQTAESKVALYQDQVYLGVPSAQLFPLFDLERIEVLRGPQGTLYGKNAAGGAIAVTSKMPGDTLGGYGRLSLGNLDGLDAEGAVNIPLTATLSSRSAFVLRSRDGYLDEVGSGEKVNDVERWAARTVLAFKPNESTDVVFNLHGGRSQSTHNNSMHRGLFDADEFENGAFVRASAQDVLAGNAVDILGYSDPNPDPYVNTYGTDTFADIELFGASVLANFTLGNGHVVTSVTGYELSDRHVLQEGNGSPSTIFTIDWGPSDFKQLSQELRIASPDSGKFRWVAGVFVFDERGDVNNFYNMADIDFLLGFEAFDQFYTQTTRDYGTFGQATWGLSDRLNLTAGGRGSYEKRTLDHITYIGGADRSHDDTLVDVNLAQTWNEWSARLALDYRLREEIMVFASINRGFTTGGFNTGAFNDPEGATDIFNPEIVVSYEAGFKSTLMDKRVRLNATAFIYAYSDLQVFTFTSTGQQSIENASDASVRGLELELQALPTNNLQLSASLGLLKAQYEDFVRGTEDLSGNRMIGAPEVQFDLAARYRWPVSFGALSLYGNLTYVGKRYYDERQFEDIASDGGDINLDAGFRWQERREKLSIALWAKNLSDEVTVIDVVDVGLFGYQNVWHNTPRTWGVSLEYSF